jgi:hypothetical protein
MSPSRDPVIGDVNSGQGRADLSDLVEAGWLAVEPEREMESTSTREEPKALRLARYLKEFVGLRSTTVRDVREYEVLWFGDVPQEPECQSPAWNDGGESGGLWLEVRKQQLPKLPEPPEILLPWIDQQALRRATAEAPSLRPSILLPDANAELNDGETPSLVERRLEDHPEVRRAYEGYLPDWEAWSSEHRRREAIQTVYAELFRMHTQVRKQGEIVELVLGLGLLDWQAPLHGKAIRVRRHIVTAQVDLHFDPASGVIRLEGAAAGAQLRIEDDMLEAELRPDRSHYASVGEQLAAIGDDIWDKARMHTALKSWAGALHADSQWSSELKPGSDGHGRPLVSLAPALILRKRSQAGMVRIYDTLIDHLSRDAAGVPSGWRGLVQDEDDVDGSDSWEHGEEPSGRSTQGPQEVFFPLPANREQRRIVEAINQRRGVLVQGPPGTGKSHTIANLVCHLLATGKRVLITAETGRALKVLKEKLPKEIQPLCVSLLGQGGDAFAELNTAVQGITTRQAAYAPGAYDERLAEIERELDVARRKLAEIDTEIRSLREDETCPHSLLNDAYNGTASQIAERVANERELYGWLQLPLEASDDPPVTGGDMLAWLGIRRRYDDEATGLARLQVVSTGSLPTPTDFGFAVTAERDAKEAVDQLAELCRHRAYSAFTALAAHARNSLAEDLQCIEQRRRCLERRGSDWLRKALHESLRGRQALWQALHDRSCELLDQIDRLMGGLGAQEVRIPENKDRRAIRSDAASAATHLTAGGKWPRWGIFTPKEVKERLYLKDQVTVDGQGASTAERLQVVCNYLDIGFAMAEFEQAWADRGGLPENSDPRLRLVALKEHVAILGEALAYAETCSQRARAMAAATPAVPEPDWLSGETQEWLNIIEASAAEERRRVAAAQVTGCLRELRALRDLHDVHPVVGSLIEAVEQRDVTAYSQAHALVVLHGRIDG